MAKGTWIENHPLQRLAHQMVAKALESGLIKRPLDCERCDQKSCRVIAHHDDYERPLAVEWICDWCHFCEHETKMGRIPPSKRRRAAPPRPVKTKTTPKPLGRPALDPRRGQCHGHRPNGDRCLNGGTVRALNGDRYCRLHVAGKGTPRDHAPGWLEPAHRPWIRSAEPEETAGVCLEEQANGLPCGKTARYAGCCKTHHNRKLRMAMTAEAGRTRREQS